jgi:hypothetical protein
MANEDRERQFERALARRLRDVSSDSVCPDAETLSAYYERTLPVEEMAVLKDHISRCERCHEILALTEKSEPMVFEDPKDERVVGFAETPAAMRAAAPEFSSREAADEPPIPAPATTQPGARSGPRWRWLVPMGALAAATIVWVGVREVRMQEHAERTAVQMARNLKPEPALTPPPPSPAHPSAKMSDQAANTPRLSAPSGDSVLDRWETEAAPKASSQNAISSQADAVSRTEEKSRGAVAGRIAPLPQAPPPSDAAKPSSGTAAESTNSGVAAEPKRKKEETPGSASQDVEPPPSASNGQSISGMNAAAMQSNMRSVMALAGADRHYVVAPDEKYSWRVGDAGKIERSTDRGKTWKPQKSGVTVDLTAGSATSDKVCWIIGKSGTILLSTEGGKHWKQITSPIQGDLGGIHATDASHASVWDLSNRYSFDTADGGVTWIPSTSH